MYFKANRAPEQGCVWMEGKVTEICRESDQFHNSPSTPKTPPEREVKDSLTELGVENGKIA